MIIFAVVILTLLLATACLVCLNLLAYRRPKPGAEGVDHGSVTVIVPARNEAANIEDCVDGLLTQTYHNLKVVVLDDGSSDDTAERVLRLAQSDARLRLERGDGLPRGWAGKTHACWEASAYAEGDWLLFVDADTRHQPRLIELAVQEASVHQADLLSTFPRQITGTLGEALTAPFIYWVLFTLLPVWQVWRSRSPAFAAACGQFLLVRRSAYSETGGHSAIPTSLHDGLHLARLFKQRGKRVRLADLSEQISCRMYRGWRECWDGFTRNAYQGVGSMGMLLFLTLWLGALGLTPYALLILGISMAETSWTALAAAQIAVLMSIQAALRSRFRYRWSTVLLHPLGIAALIAIQWASRSRLSRDGVSVWKGRSVVLDA